jgi:hypothetical protein
MYGASGILIMCAPFFLYMHASVKKFIRKKEKGSLGLKGKERAVHYQIIIKFK